LKIGLQVINRRVKWVKEHIHSFGGDPDNITGSGLSSGGISIGSLLFETDGNLEFFHSAVMQSGSYAPLIQTVKEAQPMSDLVFQLSGCETAADRIQCIRRETTRVVIHCKLPCIFSLIQANHSITTIWGPTIDGTIVPRQHFKSLRRGLLRFTKENSKNGNDRAK
jgi:acetylcholinesterase